MNWIFATLKFTASAEESIGLLRGRYGVSTSGTHTLDGTPVALSYTPPPTSIAITVEADNYPLTRFRLAEIEGGSLPLTLADDGGTLVQCWWPETLISDLRQDPRPEGLGGMQIIEESQP